MRKNRIKKPYSGRRQLFLVCMLVSLLLTGCSRESVSQDGQIYLYGEQHSSEQILAEELALWEQHYNEDGMRHLFVELPYYTAEFLNVWMQAEDDTILEEIYQDWEGTAIHTENVKQFYQSIKANCPETIFHGTDVGHQYATTGSRFLEYLEANNQKDSEQYTLAREAIKQGQTYYQIGGGKYRENAMTENFIREFDRLGGIDVMGFYGSAHTGLTAMDYETGSVPCMANQLRARYGDCVHSEDLSPLARDIEPLRMDSITINGKEYDAAYFGSQDLSAIFPEYVCREFWRLENAYEDFQSHKTSGDMLPYDNFPMIVETGQVFVVKYTKTDGTVTTHYYRSDGNTWQDNPTTEEFLLEK